MSKNQRNIIEYTIKLDSVSTNGFMTDVFQDSLKGFLKMFNENYVQSKATLELVSILKGGSENDSKSSN